MDIGIINQSQISRMQMAGGMENVSNVAATHAAETGQIDGCQAEMEIDISSMIADSMEEVSSMFEEHTTKTMGTREMGIKRKMDPASLAKAAFWAEKFPDMPNADLLMKLLRSARASGMNLEQLMKQLGEFSSDVCHQDAALDILEEMIRQNGGQPRTPEEEQLLNLIKDARKQLEAAHGTEIQAGNNLSEAIKNSGEPVDRHQAMRDLYRSEVLGFTTPQECFRSLMARGEGAFAKSLDFLMNSCNVDMTAATPSTSTEELRRIMLDLQCVNVLRFCIERFNGLAGRMMKQFDTAPLLNGEGMTGKMLDFTEKSILDARDMAGFVSECGVLKLLAKMDFMREAHAIFRSLSNRLFKDNEGRSRMLDAAQEYLDELIQQEENENSGSGSKADYQRA